MIDAYADGLLSKQEFEPRIKKAKQRLMKLEGEQKNQADEEMQRNNLKVIVGCMQEFSEKIEKGIKGLDWEAKRKIICAIVKQIEIDDEVQIIYKVSPNNLPQNKKRESLQYCSRRIHPGRRPHPVHKPVRPRTGDNFSYQLSESRHRSGFHRKL